MTHDPDSSTDARSEPAKLQPEPMPRWVKLFGGALALVALLVGLLLVVGGGQHGPSQHFGGDKSKSAKERGESSDDRPKWDHG